MYDKPQINSWFIYLFDTGIGKTETHMQCSTA